MATALTTATVTVNAAFFQEIKEVNQELWSSFETLRQLCASKSAILADPRRLVRLLAELRDQLALHFALEEAYGYFDDPLDVCPTICESATTLRQEHRDLYHRASALAEYADTIFRSGRETELVTRVPAKFWTLDRIVQRHEHREIELILRQFEEIGGMG